jgi:predicted ArsR family transcriptional regulator
MREVSKGTRARIIGALRSGEKTVRELKTEMGLTGNAIRLHLETLEREGWITLAGTRAGTRKPHNIYRLTPQAYKMEFAGCEPLLSDLLTALSSRLTEGNLREVLVETGRQLALHNPLSAGKARTEEDRIKGAVHLLRTLGGSPRIERHNGTVHIRSTSCPWAAVSMEHPEVCVIAEELLTQLIGLKVHQVCERGDAPKCSFRFSARAA